MIIFIEDGIYCYIKNLNNKMNLVFMHKIVLNNIKSLSLQNKLVCKITSKWLWKWRLITSRYEGPNQRYGSTGVGEGRRIRLLKVGESFRVKPDVTLMSFLLEILYTINRLCHWLYFINDFHTSLKAGDIK